MIENERDKKRKISKRILRLFPSHSLSLFSHSTCIIYDVLRIRVCVEDHMASAAQRIAFSGGGGEVKQSPIKRGGKKSGQKGPFLSRGLHVRIVVHTRTSIARVHSLTLSLSFSFSTHMRAASHLRIMS